MGIKLGSCLLRCNLLRHPVGNLFHRRLMTLLDQLLLIVLLLLLELELSALCCSQTSRDHGPVGVSRGPSRVCRGSAML